ncbi:YheC/YheD family protein [Paenibacillus sp. GCM10027626]|uniref:YheC/YheD family protein n=1 Tax=Paenibacillus sp. GCM10027626 TaxID=3273411 RepID=UPI003633610B
MTGLRMKSKWLKTNVLLQSHELQQFIPATKPWSPSCFQMMLDQYAMIYLKPDIGTFGKGVIRAEKKPHGVYTFQLGTRLYTFSSLEQMIDRLQRIIGTRRYIVQQGIHLLSHMQRRFDIRVMIQKNPANEWEATGIIGRLGNPRKIVTNYHSGGTPLPFELLMQSYLSLDEMPQYQASLNQLGIEVARQLEQQLPSLKEIGVDVAIDLSLQPWILEVNTRPDPYIFRKLNDKAVFRKIYCYCVGYGRIKKKRKRRMKLRRAGKIRKNRGQRFKKQPSGKPNG